MTEAAAAPIDAAVTAADAAPGKGESFRDAMERLGGDEVFADPGPRVAKLEAEKAAAEGEEATEPPKTPEPAKPDPAAKVESLKALAKELGYQLEDAAVTNKERAEWRRMRKEHTDAIRNAEASAKKSIEELQRQAEAEINLGKELRDAQKARDYNKIAKTLGFEDWNGLQEDVAKAVTDPAYQEVLELKQWKAQQEKLEQERQEQWRQQQEQQARIAQQNQYRQNLSAGMKESTDPLVKAFADDPMFVNLVFQIQDANWDGGSEVIRPERAIHMKPPGATMTLHDQLKGLKGRLDSAFRTEAAAATETEAPKKRQPPPPKGPGFPSKPAKESDHEWRARFRADMEKAVMEEKRQERLGSSRRTG